MEQNFTITNIKSSVKINPPVDLTYINQRCKDLGASCNKYGNLVSIKYKNWSFVLFKHCDFKPNPSNHLNVTSCKTVNDTIQAVDDFFDLIERPNANKDFCIDNYSVTSTIGHKIDLESFYLSNRKLLITCV